MSRAVRLAALAPALLALPLAACTSSPSPPGARAQGAPLPFVDTARTGTAAGPRVRLRRAPAPPASALYADPTARTNRRVAGSAAARWHLAQLAGELGLDARTLASAKVALVHDLGHGPIVAKLAQEVGGVPVVRTSLAFVMDRSYALVAVTGELAPVPAAAVAAAPQFALSAEQAIAHAITDTGAPLTTLRRTIVDAGGYQRVESDSLAVPGRARQVFFPVGGALVPAYQTEIVLDRPGSPTPTEGYRTTVAADDGRVLLRASIVDDANNQYRVWAQSTGDKRPLDGPVVDYTPHPTGLDDDFFPAFLAPNLVTVNGLNHPEGGGTDPWLPNGATTTNGNNVNAYADLQFPDGLSSGDVVPNTTATAQFDRVFDTGGDPQSTNDQIKAAVTHLFYVNNWLHDFWYDSGFDEAAGNAQEDNLGRGGAGGDPILAEGQDSSGTNNANMFTPGDGASPVMQMYIFDAAAGGARPDGTIDTNIITHEFGHYWHHRLVDCGSSSCRAMSEGWGDFLALHMNMRPGDDLDGVFAMGAYVLPSFTANAAYFGIRRYPYSRRYDRSPLTFRHMRNGEALPPADSPPRSDVEFLQGVENWEFHNAGEIWCLMVWTGLVDLLADSQGPSPRFTFNQGRRRYADYLVAGMIATPVEPTFTQQRDAILAAALAADAIDHAILVNAYAKRGFGPLAVSPPQDSFNGAGIVEDFGPRGRAEIVAVTLVEDPTACDADGVLDAGETGRLRVTIRNAGEADLVDAALSVSTTAAGVVFTGSTTATYATLAPTAVAIAELPVRLDEVQPTPTRPAFTIRVAEPGSPIAPLDETVVTDANLDLAAATASTDDVQSPFPVWTMTGGFARTAITASHVFSVPPPTEVTDATLASPAIAVGTAAFTLTFRERRKLAAGDGAVLEYSTDGTTWLDAATIATTGYSGTVPAGDNPLAGRMAWTGNVGYPGFVARTIDFGTALASQTVYLRFRLGGDSTANGGSAWQLDDLAVTGAGTPFPLTTVDDGSCLPGIKPIANAGPDADAAASSEVTLDGTGSSDTDGTVTAYHWTQIGGPLVNLAAVSTPNAHFTAPGFVAAQPLTFQLVVVDDDNRQSNPDTVVITVVPEVVLPDAAPAPDAPVETPDAEAAPDAEPAPDAMGPGIEDGDGGCCQTGPESRTSGLLLAFAVAIALRRRRKTVSSRA
jgi:MYXO-CTERM domain-containing protein